MSVFAYDPSAAKAWANGIVEYLNGGSESVNACSKKFNEQVEKLVQPNVWTGAAASKNYQNFMEVHNALISFTNSFGEAFEESMNSINTAVANLEIANLGADTNVSSTFGSLTYDQLTALSEQNIDKEVVRYNYDVIISIGEALTSIESTLESVYEGLKNKINILNNGSSVWDGEGAESSKTNLLNVLDTNMTKIKEGLSVCIKNISEAGKAAQSADRA